MAKKHLPAENVMLKRAYEHPAPEDGIRILVDRLWPRGLKKENAAFDQWVKGLAPSTELRKWFGHEQTRWPEFKARYSAELCEHGDEVDQLRALAREGRITLVYAARDTEHNDAVVLRDVLLDC